MKIYDALGMLIVVLIIPMLGGLLIYGGWNYIIAPLAHVSKISYLSSIILYAIYRLIK
jgi:TRAP-type C4-dicarboxylate transport system permease small subunit